MEDKDTVWQTACGFVFLWFVDQKKKGGRYENYERKEMMAS